MNDPTVANVVIIAGAEAVQSGAAPALREIAERTGMGIFNTWAAKGLFPWNHPAHLGTIGLQSGDIELAGLGDFDDVVLCGVSNDEMDRLSMTEAGINWREVLPVEIGSFPFPVRALPTPRPRLYDDLAAACQPLFAEAAVPLNPARAASDLAGWLPQGAVACGDAGRSGFWLGRTFPTRELASVQLPTRPAAGFAITQALIARRTGRVSIAVIDELDEVSRSVAERATDLVVEVWTRSGPELTSDERIDRLDRSHRSGGVHVLELGIRFDAIDALIAVAGAPRWDA